MDKALEPFQENQHGSRFSISGPDMHLGASQALMLGMALHELATNAAKYGALSSDSGHVRITWDLNAQTQAAALNLCWQESGGPHVQAPRHKGFGSVLIERGLVSESGQSSLEFFPAGLRLDLGIADRARALTPVHCGARRMAAPFLSSQTAKGDGGWATIIRAGAAIRVQTCNLVDRRRSLTIGGTSAVLQWLQIVQRQCMHAAKRRLGNENPFPWSRIGGRARC